MAVYVIGDVQGCDEALDRLLQQVGFNPGVDTAFFLGDLVNRGPSSEAVVRRIIQLGSSARCVLGNHDLHALAVFHGLRQLADGDTIGDLIRASDAPQLFGWLADLPMVMHEHNTLMVHAGVLPQWSLSKIIATNRMFTQTKGRKGIRNMLSSMFSDHPRAWREDLAEADAVRVAVNAFTRLRFCAADGTMDFASKGGLDCAPPGHTAWFDAPGRLSATERIVFGHWSALGLVIRDDVLSLDTGCAWGGQLTAAELLPNGGVVIHQVQAR